MSANRFQLNDTKTEFTWFVPPRHCNDLPSDQLAVSPVQVAPVTLVRDLDVYLVTGCLGGAVVRASDF